MNWNSHAPLRAVLIAALLLASTLAHAYSVQRNFTPRFSVTARGDLLIVGNTLMTCPDADAACAAARAGGAVNNNAFNMVWTNTDGVATVPANSSTATLSIPGGSTVLFAGLYWGADTSAGTVGTDSASAISNNAEVPGDSCAGRATLGRWPGRVRRSGARDGGLQRHCDTSNW